ncbi:hypothetical protein [Streptomyces zaomyceticus]|uniref:hypothetical protein n=1 Tax=Streptomyces zaomyceticus TaxID=68286 RepID=UPI002E21E551
MSAAKPMTGIANADELLELAYAYNLTVDIETKTADGGFTSHIVRISIPVPPAYAGKELGRLIAAETLTLLWTKSGRKGSRGRLDDATRFDSTSSRKLRTLREVRAAVEILGRESNEHARATAPTPEEVVDAPHSVHVNGRTVNGSVSPDAVRHVVKTLRFKGWTCHQDETGTIHTPTTRYVPLADQTAGAATTPVDERQHVRVVDGGHPVLIPTRVALDEMNAAMMGPGKKDVREMSEGRGNARIIYRDERGTVELRAVDSADTPVVQEQRPTDAELTGPLPAELAEHFAEKFPAVAEGRALPVRADMLRPGMVVAWTDPANDRPIQDVKSYAGPGTPWVRTTREPVDVHDAAHRVFEPGHHVMITRDSIARLYATQTPADAPEPRPAAVVLAADPIPVGGSVLTDMPGEPVGIAGVPTREAVAHDEYVAQERAGDHWQLPNHDNRAHLFGPGVIGAIAYVRSSSEHARVTVDTDGTVYLSNGRQAARYIPVSLIADSSADLCPGCGTPYASNGDGPCTGGRSLSAEERQQAAAKDQRRAAAYAGRWWAEQGTDAPTDDALRDAFQGSGKGPRPELYPAIRDAIAASMPPVAAAPLFAAHAAYETVLHASLTPGDLQDVARHMEELRRAAPRVLHTQIHAAAVAADEAWPVLKTAGTLAERNDAHDRAADAVVACRTAILAVAPHAHRMHGTDLPATADAIRAAVRAYNAVDSTPGELDGIATGPARVRVTCRSDKGSGWNITALITAGVDAPSGFFPAHPPLVVRFRRTDGRLDAAESTSRLLGAMFRVNVPVEYVADRRV